MAKGFELEPAEKAGVYRAIKERRDVRDYRPDEVPGEVLARVLDAAHHAPSVGFMQPWNFVVIRDLEVRRRVYAHFQAVNRRAAEAFEGDRRATYQALKLQGILDAPMNLLVTCDTTRGGENVLGRFTMRHMDEYSTCLAVQNLWLAARAEGLGVGWMSIMEPAAIAELLGVPAHVIPVAYLTLGYPVALPSRPVLESVGWARRAPLDALVFADRWGQPPAEPLGAPPALDAPPRTERAPANTGAPPPEAVARLRELTKPVGSLGRLEELALRLAALQGRVHPRCERPALLLFAGDHGVVEEGVSAYRREVTREMVYQYLAGGGAVSSLARQHDVAITVVDVGVDHDFGDAAGLAHRKVRRGTRNLSREPAMTPAELEAALDAGRASVEGLGELEALGLGEMGIGNTTAASAIVAALLGLSAEQTVGRGTGVGDRALERKRAVVARALALHPARDPDSVLRCLGGYEIAALVGAIEAAAARRALVVLDGFITGAAALVAVRRRPELAGSLVAGHRGAEAMHGALLEALGLRPLLDLDLRLGEGSGAVIALGLVKSAAALMREMRTFEEANMPRPEDPRGRA
jgi:nicotinate-nucleotide--dimethylbenzimidazole phosphoribosyltransferase